MHTPSYVLAKLLWLSEGEQSLDSSHSLHISGQVTAVMGYVNPTLARRGLMSKSGQVERTEPQLSWGQIKKTSRQVAPACARSLGQDRSRLKMGVSKDRPAGRCWTQIESVPCYQEANGGCDGVYKPHPGPQGNKGQPWTQVTSPLQTCRVCSNWTECLKESNSAPTGEAGEEDGRSRRAPEQGCGSPAEPGWG